MLKEKIEIANQEIRKLYDIMDENEVLFELHDLKLHELSYYVYKNDIEVEKFNMFCQDALDTFMYDMKEFYNIDFLDEIKPLGRTSSFHLHSNYYDLASKDIVVIEEIMAYYYGYLEIANCITTNDYTQLDYELAKDLSIEEKRVLESELDFIIESLIEGYEEMIEIPRILYNYIDDFKENQVEYFKVYLEWLM